MKPSERKQELVKELASLYQKLGVSRLYGFPNQKDSQEWIADVGSVLKNLDEGDYQEFIRLSKTVGLSEIREERKKAAKEINQLLRRKVIEWKRYDFSSLDNENSQPKLKFGELGQTGHPGGAGSVFIQAEHFNIVGNGRINANGGDYIINDNSTKGHNSSVHINYGTINESTAEAIENITKIMVLVSKSQLKEDEKRQLIGNAEITKASLIQPHPDINVLQKAWNGMQVASTIGGVAQLLQMIRVIVLPLLK
jgi:hypothetical protein